MEEEVINKLFPRSLRTKFRQEKANVTEEFQSVIKEEIIVETTALKYRKAPGPDFIMIEIWKTVVEAIPEK